jgi:hypothetical protein
LYQRFLASSAVVTYQTDNKEAGILITKIRRSVASWFFGYWTKIRKYKHGMIKKLMESINIDAAKIVGYSKFDVETLTVDTKFGDVDEQLDGIEVALQKMFEARGLLFIATQWA